MQPSDDTRGLAPAFAADSPDAIPLDIVSPEALADRLAALPPPQATWARAQGFTAAAGEVLVLPAPDGTFAQAFVGTGNAAARRRGRFLVGQAAQRLPAGTYRITAHDLDTAALEEAALGWLLHSYRFARYRKQDAAPARLIAPAGIDTARIGIIAAAEALTRDLINTPAADMGPAEIEAAARRLAEIHGASINVVIGDDLLAQNFPMIHAVGRAAAPYRAPRLIDLAWGDTGPALTLVGKGVCFDTGGLDLKPAASMGLMKKDMGGSATALALARLIMQAGLPVRLRLIIAAAENSISANAMRPGDILKSRAGKTVEITNTDAEGRLVLADAIALAAEEKPDLILDFATLTGAARVALGAELPALFTADDALAAAFDAAAAQTHDPLHRLPLWQPYARLLKSDIADMVNSAEGGLAGAITAALFLHAFVPKEQVWAHFDTFAWNNRPRPGRPKGGEALALRASFALIKARYSK